MTTLNRVKAHLTIGQFAYGQVREHFVTRNRIPISIQQSPTHYCSLQGRPNTKHDTTSTATVEMWNCEASPLLEEYSSGSDSPYSHVPLAVVAAYIDSIEGEKA